MDATRKRTGKTCIGNGCDRPVWARQMCNTHYNRWRKGSPLDATVTRIATTIHDAANRHPVEFAENGCINWCGNTNTGGYGYFKFKSRQIKAHRYAYELFVGPIPAGMHVDHMCFNRRCVQPGHLRLVTNKQNGEHRSGAHYNNPTQLRGVYRERRTKKWRACVRHNGELLYLGCFDTPEEAAERAAEKRAELFTHDDDFTERESLMIRWPIGGD